VFVQKEQVRCTYSLSSVYNCITHEHIHTQQSVMVNYIVTFKVLVQMETDDDDDTREGQRLKKPLLLLSMNLLPIEKITKLIHHCYTIIDTTTTTIIIIYIVLYNPTCTRDCYTITMIIIVLQEKLEVTHCC